MRRFRVEEANTLEKRLKLKVPLEVDCGLSDDPIIGYSPEDKKVLVSCIAMERLEALKRLNFWHGLEGILYHEEGHYILKTRNEIIAELYSLLRNSEANKYIASPRT